MAKLQRTLSGDLSQWAAKIERDVLNGSVEAALAATRAGGGVLLVLAVILWVV